MSRKITNNPPSHISFAKKSYGESRKATARQSMKNNMKKLIVSLFAFVLLLVGQSAFAVNPSYVSWNTASNDCADINIANYETGAGYDEPCWNGTSITANPGETINVRVYYHNTGNETATSTNIKVTHSPNGSATTHSFTGQILSPQGNLYSSAVTVTIPSSQTLTFDSTRWYPNQTHTPAGFLSGQDGSEVLDSGGLYIGDITSGWASQGSVVVSFTVGTTPPPTCSITSFTANPGTITSGQSSALHWDTSNCSTTKLFIGNTQVGNSYGQSGDKTVSPITTTEYTIKAYLANGTLKDTENKTVTVTTPPQECKITSFSANPQTIISGGSSTLTWYTSKCTSTRFFRGTTPVGGDLFGSPVNKTVLPTETTTYTVKAYKNGVEKASQNLTLNVTTAPEECKITSFSANPQTIISGGSSTLTWYTSKCTSTRLFRGTTPVGGEVSGSPINKTVSPTDTTTYTVKAYKNGVEKDSKNLTVTVTPTPQECKITSFSANPQTIISGGSSTLTWYTSKCTSTRFFRGTTPVGGDLFGSPVNKTVLPTETTTYTVKAYKNGVEKASQNLTLNVTTAPEECKITSFSANPQTIISGGSSTLTWYTSKCTSTRFFRGNTQVGGEIFGSPIDKTVSPTVTTTYTVKAYKNGVEKDSKNLTVTVTPTPQECKITSFSANPQTITNGGSSTLTWYTSKCANTKLFVGMKSFGDFGSPGVKTVWPEQTTTYTVKAYRANGTVSETRDLRVTVTAPQACSITNFSANPSSITEGDSSTLSWDTSNCDSTKLSVRTKSFGNFDSSGSKTVWPTITTEYTLKAYTADGIQRDMKQTTVTVNNIQNCVINDFTADPSSITEGESSTLTWETSNCATTKLFRGSTLIGIYDDSFGNKIVWPTTTTTYTLKTYNLNGIPVGSSTTKVTVDNSILTPPSTCQITSLIANPSTIPAGESSSISWETNDCMTTKLFVGYHQIGVYGPSWSQTVSPESTTNYTLKAYDSSGIEKDTENIRVTVSTEECRISFFYGVPQTINAGESSILNWNTNNCGSTKLFIGYNPIGTYEPSEAITVWPEHTTTYTLKAYKENGTWGATAQATIEVNALQNCAINSFTANPTSINEGGNSLLSWNTSNCTNVTISNVDGEVSNSGTQTVYPTDTTTYVLTAVGQNGGTQNRSVTVYVNSNNYPSNCTISSFYATPSSIEEGQSGRLYWTTNNCSYVNIEGIGTVSATGSRTVWPTETRTYVLNAEGQNGVGVSAETTIYVDEENNDDACEIVNFDASDTSIEDGDEVTLEWNTRNCDYVRISDLGNVSDDGEEDVSPNEDTTYVLTAYDYDGSHQTDSIRIYVDEDNGNNNNDDCSIDSFTASDTYINQGDDVNLRWRTTDCDDVSLTNIGDVSDDGDEDVSPYQTITYTLRAYGNGSDSRSIRINVDDYNDNDEEIYNTNVVTTVATNISQTGAQINGLITSSNYGNANTYFEYGTNVNLNNRTASRTSNGNNNLSEYITNLSANTIYYFRAVSEGTNGISRGAIEVFQTLRYPTVNNEVRTIREVREVVVQGPTVYGSESPIMLQIENQYQTIGVGDTINYVVFYKNISSSTLTNPMVQVFIPQGITFINSSRGTYSEGENTLSVPIEDLNPDAEGTIYIEARVDSLDSNMAQVVTTAVLIYTNPNGAQENAMAYVLNSPRGNVLGASAFFGNIFGMSLIGWLLIIILILLLVLIARSYYGRRNLLVSPFRAENNHL